MRGGSQSSEAIVVVAGTRPEAIKLAPVILALRRSGRRVTVCATGQHRELLHGALGDFGLVADLDLALMQPGQRPEQVVAAALTAIGGALDACRPSAVVVQGDTASAYAGALAGAYARVPVVHVEAGLRSGSDDPFPEEFQRRGIAQLATLHFAPTAAAVAALRAENIAPSAVHLVGNTGIDAVHVARARLDAEPALRAAVEAALPRPEAGRPLLLATVHRRENHDRLPAVAAALAALAKTAQVVVPVHPHPVVQRALAPLAGVPGVHLLPPLGYLGFVALLRRAHVVLTDSGGVQEEAPALGCPVLVLRDVTERPEGVTEGTAQLVGTTTATIGAAARRLLTDDLEHARRARIVLPYGDGAAAQRIAAVLTASAPADTQAV